MAAMSLTDIQREVVAMPPEEQRRLMGFLTGLQISREEGETLGKRFADKRPDSWISAEEMERRLHEEP